jgi:hypothetical protein
LEVADSEIAERRGQPISYSSGSEDTVETGVKLEVGVEPVSVLNTGEEAIGEKRSKVTSRQGRSHANGDGMPKMFLS